MYIINDTGAAWSITKVVKKDVAPDLNDDGDMWSYQIRFDGNGNDKDSVVLHFSNDQIRDKFFRSFLHVCDAPGYIERTIFQRFLESVVQHSKRPTLTHIRNRMQKLSEDYSNARVDFKKWKSVPVEIGKE